MLESRASCKTEVLALLVALLLLPAAGCERSKKEEDAAAVARLLPGPDFELLGLDGRRHRLSSYRGKVVLVNFWATWCTSCREEIPALDRVYAELASEGIEILGIATDEEGAEKVRPYVAEIGMAYPVLLDPEAVSPAIFGGLDGYPSTFILDAQGLIYSSYLGAQAEEVFRQDLLYLLDAPPSPPAQLPDAGRTAVTDPQPDEAG